MIKHTLTIALALLLLIPRAVAAEELPFHDLPKGAILGLPKVAGLAAEWVISPGTLGKLKDKYFSFNVDPKGKICLGSDRVIFYPELVLALTTKVPIQEFIWLAEGNMLARSGNALGFLTMDLDEINKPEDAQKAKGSLSFSSRFTVPYKSSHLYAGLGDHFYLVGRNEKQNRNEISAWNLADEKAPAKPLYATAAPIDAVAGSPEKTYFATGREVFALARGETAPKSIYVHPHEVIRELIYRPDAGLFFTTDNGAGYIGKKEQFIFLAYPGVQLRLRSNALYVRMGTTANGIMRITGAEHFADLRLDPAK